MSINLPHRSSPHETGKVEIIIDAQNNYRDIPAAPRSEGSERDGQIGKERQAVLNHAFAKHPERFTAKMPRQMALPEADWINKLLPQNGEPLRNSILCVGISFS